MTSISPMIESKPKQQPQPQQTKSMTMRRIGLFVLVGVGVAILAPTALRTSLLAVRVPTVSFQNHPGESFGFQSTMNENQLRHDPFPSSPFRYHWSRNCPRPSVLGLLEHNAHAAADHDDDWIDGNDHNFPTAAVNACCCSIVDHGAIGDNSTLNTVAIQSTIDTCHERCSFSFQSLVETSFEPRERILLPPQSRAATNHSPPVAVVYVPPGRFRTGSLVLRSHTRFHLSRGAAVYGSDDPGDYPLVPMIPDGYETGQRRMWRALLSASHATEVSVTGDDAGYAPGSLATFGSAAVARGSRSSDASLSVIDGVGWKWWCKSRSMPIPQAYCREFNPDNETIPNDTFRPKLIEFYNCTNIVLDRFTARNSPVWFIHPFLSKNIAMTNLTVLAPRAVGNTDGLDPDSCENVLMDSCYIDVGDDGVSIKSTNHSNAMVPTRNVTMRNLRIVSRNWCIGSATFGGIFDILFEDSSIGDLDTVTSPWAFKFKSHQNYPGPIENITIRNIQLGRIGPTPWMYPSVPGSAFVIALHYGEAPAPHPSGRPLFWNVTLEDISVASAGIAGNIQGFPQDCLGGLTLRNISIEDGRAEWICQHVDLDSLTISNVRPPVSCTGGCSGSIESGAVVSEGR